MNPAHLSAAIALASLAYLAQRALHFSRRQRLSYLKMPFPPAGWTPPPTRPAACLLGLATADALGMHREMIPPALARLRFGSTPSTSRGLLRFMRRAGSISDDTQHTWLLATCLDDAGHLDDARWRAALIDWFDWRVGPGKATEAAVSRLRAGQPSPGDPTSQGNGAAMRVAPLAIALGHDHERLDAAVLASALPTHAHPAAIEGARQTARLIAWCLTAQGWSLDAARAACLPPEDEDWHEVWSPPSHSPPTSGWVRDTLRAAIWLLERHPDDLRAGLATLYALGGDTDTIGAIYAACLGALHGPAPIVACAPPHTIQGAHLLAAEAARLTPKDHT